jgi:hypothetical protein
MRIASGAGDPAEDPQAGVEQPCVAETCFCQQRLLPLRQDVVKAFALHPNGTFHHLGGRSVTPREGRINPQIVLEARRVLVGAANDHQEGCAGFQSRVDLPQGAEPMSVVGHEVQAQKRRCRVERFPSPSTCVVLIGCFDLAVTLVAAVA